MHIARKQLPSSLMGADKGRYVMRVTFELLPSLLMGEGSGGGEDSTSSPPTHPSPTKGGRGMYLPLSALQGREGYLDPFVSLQ
jgi:hypothetical protein